MDTYSARSKTGETDGRQIEGTARITMRMEGVKVKGLMMNHPLDIVNMLDISDSVWNKGRPLQCSSASWSCGPTQLRFLHLSPISWGDILHTTSLLVTKQCSSDPWQGGRNFNPLHPARLLDNVVRRKGIQSSTLQWDRTQNYKCDWTSLGSVCQTEPEIRD